MGDVLGDSGRQWHSEYDGNEAESHWREERHKETSLPGVLCLWFPSEKKKKGRKGKKKKTDEDLGNDGFKR